MRGSALEDVASIKPSGTQLYTDYGRTASGRVETRDKLGWHCYIRGIDEQSFKAALCADYRGAVDTPAPRTVPFSGPSLLVTYRRRVIVLERKIARLETSDPVKACEQYIAALEQRVIDIENQWEQCETENYQLRKLTGWPLAG
jgi:hypothetical protein